MTNWLGGDWWAQLDVLAGSELRESRQREWNPGSDDSGTSSSTPSNFPLTHPHPSPLALTGQRLGEVPKGIVVHSNFNHIYLADLGWGVEGVEKRLHTHSTRQAHLNLSCNYNYLRVLFLVLQEHSFINLWWAKYIYSFCAIPSFWHSDHTQGYLDKSLFITDHGAALRSVIAVRTRDLPNIIQ